MVNSPLNSMGIYTVYDHALLLRTGDSPNGLHTDLKFRNHALQCCLFEPREAKYGKAVGRERATSFTRLLVVTETHTYTSTGYL